jgi:hypothetical protein
MMRTSGARRRPRRRPGPMGLNGGPKESSWSTGRYSSPGRRRSDDRGRRGDGQARGVGGGQRRRKAGADYLIPCRTARKERGATMTANDPRTPAIIGGERLLPVCW